MRRMILLLLLALGLPAHAQAVQQDLKSDCHGVITSTLASGTRHPHFQRCVSEAVPYVSRAIRDAANQRDIERFRFLAEFAFFVRDPAIFEAGLELAEHEGADASAKVLGLLVALRQIDPGIAFRGGQTRFFREPLHEPCADEIVFPTLTQEFEWLDRGLAQNAAVRLRAVAASLSEAGGTPLLVRRFATCTLLLIPDPADNADEATSPPLYPS
jgi:hypothetical protein